jgi:hypothetical protein
VTVDAVPPIMASDGSIEPADGLLLR